MKQFYAPFVLLFLVQFSFAQVVFQNNTIINLNSTASSAEVAVTADINGDGFLDIVVASGPYRKIAWYENIDGLGQFGVQNIVTTEFGPGGGAAYSMQLVDIDSDGDIDIVSLKIGVNDGIMWYENIDGLGTFSDELIISTEVDTPQFVYAVDLDNDNDLDVISASTGDDKIAWYENVDGLGTFGPQQVITTNVHNPKEVYGVDVNGDGNVDVISVSTNDSKIAWYENTNGLGNFGPQQIIDDQLYNPKTLAVSDLDGDGDFDVLSSNANNDKLVWFENVNGLGVFGTQQIITSEVQNVTSIYTVDIDGDGDMDVFSTSTVDDKIAWYENLNGMGNFSDQQIISNTINMPSFVHAGDLDGDGDLDVVGASQADNYVAWYENMDGQGDFGEEVIMTELVNRPVSVYAVDIDNDGDKDVISASTNDNKISLFKNNNGLGSFDKQIIISADSETALSVFAEDMDGDGDKDILSAAFNGDKLAWYENIDGMGFFGEEQIITVEVDGPRFIVASDVDNDGDMDVLSASGNDDKIAWYENLDGLGDFGSQQIITTQADNASMIFVHDIDGDNDIDVISASRNDNKIAWYENTDGEGTFGAQLIISENADAARWVTAGDIDNDGDIDVVSALNTNKIAWYENTDGLGGFSDGMVISSNVFGAEILSIFDIDGDSDLDVVSVTSEDRINWHENIDGEGNFSEIQIAAETEDQITALFPADIDGDGALDLLYAMGSKDNISWFENLGDGFNQIQGVIRNNFAADNCDEEDTVVGGILVSTSFGSNSSTSTFSSNTGFYQIYTGEGSYNTSLPWLPQYYTSNPAFFISNFEDGYNIDEVDFCIEPIGAINDLTITIYPSFNDPRPGFDTTYQLVYRNIGTTQLSGSVSFEFDDSKLQFLNASQAVSSQTSNTLVFDYLDLSPFETRTINLEFNVFAPPTTEIGDELISTATINPVSGDETENNNVFELQQTVIGSYDPNDITCLEGDQILIEDTDKYLHYLIRFQNTGTASAINIRVENVLDDKLDWTTMQLESLSHDGRVEIMNGSEVSFIFDNINLPDSTNDESNSHGYIAYKIKPRNDVSIGDVFYNTADIYFDFNPPITTNTASTEIVDALSINDVDSKPLVVYPNPTNDVLFIRADVAVNEIRVVDINGRQLKLLHDIPNTQSFSVDVSDLNAGLYFLNIHAEENAQTIKFIKL